MAVQVHINTLGSAFCGPDGEPDEAAEAVEVARILRRLAEAVEFAGTARTDVPVFDAFGNRCGDITFA